MSFELFTDGGCWPNPGDGGWAFILRNVETRKEVRVSGGKRKTTNNRMELQAVIEGLGRLPIDSSVALYSDSEYVVKGINSWMEGWKKKGWADVKNKDLWVKVDTLVGSHQVKAVWVRGHDGHAENERCDRMAMKAYSDMVRKRDA